MNVTAVRRFRLGARSFAPGEVVSGLSVLCARRLISLGSAAPIPEAMPVPPERTRNSIVQVGPSDPDDPELLKQMRQAEKRWRKDSAETEAEPGAIPALDSFGVAFAALERTRITGYVPLADPVCEAERVRYNAAIAESNLRVATQKVEREYTQGRSKVFAESLSQRITELLGSRKAHPYP